MKILLDPNIAVLIKDMSDSECAEILRCIFEYPNRDCEIGVWKYIKTQIDRDAQKYKDKCNRVAQARETHIMKSDMKSNMISGVKKSSKENNNEKDIDIEKDIDSSNAFLPVENSVENLNKQVEKFLITEYFSFQSMAKIIPAFAIYAESFIPAVLNRAERTIKQKRQGQRLTMRQIADWIEQENNFYQQNHKD